MNGAGWARCGSSGTTTISNNLATGSSQGAFDTASWGRFVFFSDPDGNGWAVQQLPPRD